MEKSGPVEAVIRSSWSAGPDGARLPPHSMILTGRRSRERFDRVTRTANPAEPGDVAAHIRTPSRASRAKAQVGPTVSGPSLDDPALSPVVAPGGAGRPTRGSRTAAPAALGV